MVIIQSIPFITSAIYVADLSFAGVTVMFLFSGETNT